MSNPNQYAVLLKELASPAADRLKRAFSTFNNLTDADAIRLAAGARGILMRHLGLDAARALQSAVQAEGVGAVVVPEHELPKLPESRTLHRIGLSDEGFAIYDLMGKPAVTPWKDVALLAAGTVQHFEITRSQAEQRTLQFSPLTGLRVRTSSDSIHKVTTDSPLFLEIILQGLTTRFQIEASQFPFRFVIDRPGFSIAEKFAWIVCEFCRNAPHALLNHGARRLTEGDPSVVYSNRQAFVDEMTWLLWHSPPMAQHGAPPVA
jgi:hypothetical protein